MPQLVRPSWPSIRFVFPHAPVQPVTINGGMRMRSWYDIVSFDLAGRADAKGVDESVARVDALIKREIERGTPASRIILAGFSQGGAVTLAAGLRRAEPLAGLVALSTYLPLGPDALAALVQTPAATRRQPVFVAHGRFDPVVPFAAGEDAASRLRLRASRWSSTPTRCSTRSAAKKSRPCAPGSSARLASDSGSGLSRTFHDDPFRG